jgi:hypothetical protein
MIDEMTGPAGWGVLDQVTATGGARPVVAGDAGYGDNTTFRLELAARGFAYVLAVKGTTSAYPGDAQPAAPARRGGPGRPAKPAYPGRGRGRQRQVQDADGLPVFPAGTDRGNPATG